MAPRQSRVYAYSGDTRVPTRGYSGGTRTPCSTHDSTNPSVDFRSRVSREYALREGTHGETGDFGDISTIFFPRLIARRIQYAFPGVETNQLSKLV